jgi:virulence factor Mce-like protein
MRGRRATSSIVANPVLVGAVTTLVVIVAVFLAYNANNGLPFVPTRQFNVQLENGSNLVKGNEVRAGGFRVGVISDIKAATVTSGKTVAVFKLKLDKKIGDVPADSTIDVRPRSALGLKYLQLTKGTSHRFLQDGDTIPLAQTTVPVQFDDLFKLFPKQTRDAAQDNLVGFGNAFTGRGTDLNTTIAQLPRFFGYLAPVAANLASPQTDIARFFREIGRTVAVVAPVAQTNAQLFTDMATTFEALSRDPEALKATISKSPPTLDVSTDSLRAQRPFLDDTADFSHDLRFAVRELRAALPIINPALETGTPVLRRSVSLNNNLKDVLAALRDLVRDPGVNSGLRGLVATATTLNPQLRFYGPYQTVCDYWNYFWTYNQEHFSELVNSGTTQRALLNSTAGPPNQTSSMGSGNSFEPANGENYDSIPAPAKSRGDKEFLHGQPYGAAILNNGTADCENGQRGYLNGNLNISGRLMDAEGHPFNLVADPHTPGSQGTTFVGRSAVPPGETFTREPQTGDLLPSSLTTGIYGG